MPADQADTSAPPAPPRRRLLGFYVVLAVVTAAVMILVITDGQKRHPEKPIAGGYDVSGANKCLGQQFDVKQSGEFVNFQNADDTLGGSLRLDNGKLTGDVKCIGDGKQKLEARAAGGTIKGTLGGAPLAAEQKRDPPDPGAQRPRAPNSVAGIFKLSPRSACLGGKIELDGSGKTLDLLVKGKKAGEVGYSKGVVSGTATCPRDQKKVTLQGQAVDRSITNLIIAPKGAPPPSPPTATPAGGEKVTADKQRESFGASIAVFFIAVTIVMLVARLFGTLAVKIRQPRVMGEVVAGIALGPTLFGAVLPDLQSTIFAADILPTIGLVANLGLIFYMFLVGLELDPRQLKGRVGQAAAISNASVALPLMLGFVVAIPLYERVGPDKKFVAFALYMGVAMSITAFPVLARILVERRMLQRPLGALTMACAAIDDVTAWFLIALASAVALAGSGSEVALTIALAIVFCVVMGLAVRPVLSRVATAYDEAGRVPGGWIVAIFAGILLSAWVTEEIGIAVIFGAFIMGMIMPRHAELTEDVTRRIEDFVITLLLPLFFAFTGLRTNIGLLDRPELWALTGLLILVAITGKWVGAMGSARFTGFKWRDSAVIGALMNTRGLTELIVLNLALEAGVISEALFAMLVIMALVTTFMAGPALNALDPKNELGAPVEEELEEARRESSAEFPALEVPERSVLVAPQTEESLGQLVALATPLASSEPPRELILAWLVLPPRGAGYGVRGGLQTENRLLEEANRVVIEARDELIEKGIAARGVAFISAHPGADISRLAEREEVDLVLLDGQRPLLGEGVPRGAVGEVLQEAPSDVAVLVARQDAEIELGPDTAVITPFGGAEHDWAALELSAWISSATGAPLKLLGAAGEEGDGTRVTRLLGDAGLLIQQYAGVSSEPIVARPGREGIVEAAADAGLLVVGLSDRWRQEGLGPTRSEIARAAPSPVLFVRRGTRTGALAPATDVTRFSWSAAPASR